MSSGPKTQTTTSTSEPWSGAKPYLKSLYGKAATAFDDTNRNPYTGPLTAAPNTNQTQAVDRLGSANFDANNAALQAGVNAVGGLAGKVQQTPTYQSYGDYRPNMQDSASIRSNAGKTTAFADDLASGRWLNPETNPYLKTNVETALSQASDSWNRNINPSLQDAAIRSGAYGGSRNGIATGLAASEVGKTQQQTAAQMYGANYESERQRMMQAPGMYGQASSQLGQAANVDQTNYQVGQQGRINNLNAQLAVSQNNQNAAQTAAGLYGTQADLSNAINQATLQDIQGQAAAGQQQQAWQQAQNDDQYLRYQMDQQAPWAGIPEMLSVLTGGGFQSTSSTGPNPNYRSGLQNVLGVAGAGASILGMPWASGASLGGALFGKK